MVRRQEYRVFRVKDHPTVRVLQRRRLFICTQAAFDKADQRCEGSLLFWDNARACSVDVDNLELLLPETEAAAVRLAWLPEQVTDPVHDRLAAAGVPLNLLLREASDVIRAALQPEMRHGDLLYYETLGDLISRMYYPQEAVMKARLTDLWERALAMSQHLTEVEESVFGFSQP